MRRRRAGQGLFVMTVLLAGVVVSCRGEPGVRPHHLSLMPTTGSNPAGEQLAGQGGQGALAVSKAAKKASKIASASVPLGLEDAGVFSDLDPDVFMGLPACTDAADVHIEVDKQARTLSVYDRGVAVKTYPVALGFAPEGDKKKQGDGKTPEGAYFICEMLDTDLAERYGARSMRISYPSKKDAERGLDEGLITQAQHDAIAGAIDAGKMPPQNTKLGSSIRIHGGGVGDDWTAGCIALRDEDAIEVYDIVQPGTKVVVRSGKNKGKHDRDSDGIPDQVDIHAGALKAALNGASYDGGYYKISYPMGDIAREKGCCTDVVIRALRNAGIDLQEALSKDIKKRPKAYKHIKKANTDIDHRRVKNLLVYMTKHMKSLGTDFEGDAVCGWMPGDIVLFDTLPRKGPDHIGIVVAETEGGLPLIVNNWTSGYTTQAMDLLSWVDVTHRFRVR